MSRYDEDHADSQINNSKLKSLFNMGNDPTSESLPSTDILIDEITNDSGEVRRSPDEIVHANIERAERFLDTIEDSIANGGSARMFEVASALINAVTQASASIIGTNQYEEEIRYKERLLALKEREIAVKEALGTKSGGPKTVNNILITDRESLLKVINEEEQKQIEIDMDID